MVKTVNVSEDTWQRLTNRKVKYMDKTLDETLKKILDEVEK